MQSQPMLNFRPFSAGFLLLFHHSYKIQTYSSNTPNVAATGFTLRFSGTSLFSDGTGVCVSSFIFTE